MQVADLFPPCRIQGCPDTPRNHRHVMPWQRELIEAKEKYVLVVGGVGSGKTLPACIAITLLLLAIPGNRAFIGRRSYPKLHDPTLRVFLEILERGRIEYKGYEKRDGFPHRIVLPNQAEAIFRETSDIGRWLGPEYGAAYIDEAQEETERTFTGLMERLRLPHAGDYLKFILTTNPPHHQHWIPQRFGPAAGIKVVGDSAYRTIRVSSRENKHLPPNYLKDLFANYSETEIRRIVDGEYGFSAEGKPVYAPPFRNEVHVGLPRVMDAPLIRGWDFGSRHPACTWHQVFRCRKNKVHWSILAELDAPRNTTWEQFAVEVVRYTEAMFPGVSKAMIQNAGDAAGAQMSDKGPGAIIRLHTEFKMPFRYRQIRDIDPGLNFIREQLRPTCACGIPLLVIHRRCTHVIDGFAGGYHYAEEKPGSENRKRVPVKDGFYDDVMDSVRYVGENFVRWADDPAAGWFDPATTYLSDPDALERHWSWMGA